MSVPIAATNAANSVFQLLQLHGTMAARLCSSSSHPLVLAGADSELKVISAQRDRVNV